MTYQYIARSTNAGLSTPRQHGLFERGIYNSGDTLKKTYRTNTVLSPPHMKRTPLKADHNLGNTRDPRKYSNNNDIASRPRPLNRVKSNSLSNIYVGTSKEYNKNKYFPAENLTQKGDMLLANVKSKFEKLNNFYPSPFSRRTSQQALSQNERKPTRRSYSFNNGNSSLNRPSPKVNNDAHLPGLLKNRRYSIDSTTSQERLKSATANKENQDNTCMFTQPSADTTVSNGLCLSFFFIIITMCFF